MLAEMVFDGGQIVGLVLIAVCVLVAIAFIVLEIKKVETYINNPIMFIWCCLGAISIAIITLLLADLRGDNLSLRHDLEAQGFCIQSVSSDIHTATICQDDGSAWEVEVRRHNGQWIAIANTQNQVNAPATPLQQQDLTTTTTSQPLR